MNIGAKTVLVTLCVFLIVIIMASSCTQTILPEQEEEEYYLAGNFVATGTILTDEKQEIETSVSGMIAFRVVSPPQGNLTISLDWLNLVAKSVPTEMGDSGLIGLSLVEPENQTSYDPNKGQISTDFRSNLHYELIDQKEGYRQLQSEGEADMFPSFTEEMAGSLSGLFAESLQPAEEGSTEFTANLELLIDYPSSILGSLSRLRVYLDLSLIWGTTPCQAIRIQPVFIGTGSSDPDRSGTAFNTLMTNSAELWNRCGTVRCLKFTVLDPIYLDEPAYKVLDNEIEAASLRAEVNVDDAVEIFVVKEMSTSLACSWGGGASFSSGTASAKIVSCDQQLSVPCPCPTSCQGYCPCGGCGVDPSTCGAANPYHLAHELGHTLDLHHPSDSVLSTDDSIMEPSGFCCDNPDVQSAKNCRNANNPLLYALDCLSIACDGSPDIMD
jgi:hypothetical protein